MTRRATLLWAGTSVTLLLTAWVSGSGPVGVFRPQRLSGRETSAPGEDFGPRDLRGGGGQKGHADTTATHDTVASAITWAMRVLIALVVLAVVVALAQALLEWLATRRGDVADEVDAQVLPEELLERARESEELLATGTPANAVVAAWVRLEDAVRGAGLHQDDSRTSTELVRTVIRGFGVRQEPLDELAGLYREARFSRHPVGEDMRDRAREALLSIQADLRRATSGRHAPAGPTGRGGGAR